MFTILLYVFLMQVSGIVLYNLISFLSLLTKHCVFKIHYIAVFKSKLLLLIFSIQILFVWKNKLFWGRDLSELQENSAADSGEDRPESLEEVAARKQF